MIETIKLKRKAFFLPIIVLTCFLLVYVFFMEPHNGEEARFTQMCLQHIHAWLPLMSFWWLFLIQSDYYSKGISELLKIHRKKKFVWLYHFISVIAYLCYVMILCGIFKLKIVITGKTCVQLVLEILAIASMFLVLCYLLKNITGAMIVIAAYTIYLNYFDIYRFLDSISIFARVEMSTSDECRKMVAAGVLILIGVPFYFYRPQKR